MQALVQNKLARFNALFLQKLKAECRNAAQKFWNYVRTLNRMEQAVQFIVDSNDNSTQDIKGGLDRAPGGSVWFTWVHEGPPVG
ncbi:hypothetical protein MRX96_022346 [Rhipicephalus microplus]